MRLEEFVTAEELEEQKMIWVRSGNKIKLKYRCTSGPKAGRIVPEPTACSTPKDMAKAAELLLTGKPISAQEALRIGLINKVVPLPELLPVARQIAETLCQRAPLAVRSVKQAMIQGTNLPLVDGLELEKTLNDFLVTTEDFDEGCTASIEKRKAGFRAK